MSSARDVRGIQRDAEHQGKSFTGVHGLDSSPIIRFLIGGSRAAHGGMIGIAEPARGDESVAAKNAAGSLQDGINGVFHDRLDRVKLMDLDGLDLGSVEDAIERRRIAQLDRGSLGQRRRRGEIRDAEHGDEREDAEQETMFHSILDLDLHGGTGTPVA